MDMVIRQLALAFGISVVAVSGLAAEPYSISVTRKDRNVYKIDGRDILIQTRYCYVYGYGEDAILRMNGRTGDLIFVDQKDKCDVKGVFAASEQKPGKYSVSVSRDEDDWYEVFGADLYIKTSLCLQLALGDDAVLSVGAGGTGRLVFEDGDSCAVEGIYSRLRLN